MNIEAQLGKIGEDNTRPRRIWIHCKIKSVIYAASWRHSDWLTSRTCIYILRWLSSVWKCALRGGSKYQCWISNKASLDVLGTIGSLATFHSQTQKSATTETPQIRGAKTILEVHWYNVPPYGSKVELSDKSQWTGCTHPNQRKHNKSTSSQCKNNTRVVDNLEFPTVKISN